MGKVALKWIMKWSVVTIGRTYYSHTFGCLWSFCTGYLQCVYSTTVM